MLNSKTIRIGLFFMVLVSVITFFMSTKSNKDEVTGLSYEITESINVKLSNYSEHPSGRSYSLILANNSDMTLKHNVVYLTYPIKMNNSNAEKLSTLKVVADGNKLDILSGEEVILNVYIPNEAIGNNQNLQLERPYIEIIGYMEEVVDVMRFMKSGPLEQ